MANNGPKSTKWVPRSAFKIPKKFVICQFGAVFAIQAIFQVYLSLLYRKRLMIGVETSFVYLFY